MDFLEFPKWKYSPSGGAIIVDDDEAEAALDGLWFATLAEAEAGVNAPPKAPQVALRSDNSDVPEMDQPSAG